MIRRLLPPLRILLLLVGLVLPLAGCGRGDRSQAAICERAAQLVFSEGTVVELASAPDASVPDGVATRLALRAPGGTVERHEVDCRFAGGRFSPDRLKLAAVSTDRDGILDDIHMALLLFTLEREGLAHMAAAAAIPTAPLIAEKLPVGAGVLYFLQQLINGVTLGCVVALIAIGYTLVYSIIGAINFAFGELYMIGAFMAVIGVAFVTLMGFASFLGSLLLALPAAMLLNAGYGWASERLVFRPLRQSHPLMPLIAAIGLSIVLQNYVFIAEGGRDLWLPAGTKGGFVLAEAGGFSLYLNHAQGVLLLVTVLLAGATWYLLARTPFGRAQRASSQDRGMAALVGINIDRVIAGTFALGGALAAAGGLMVASYYGGVNFVMGFAMGFKALTAAIVGGMGSFAGALLGGFIVALVETFWAGYLQGEYRDIAVFTLLIVLLVFRPQGLLGTR